MTANKNLFFTLSILVMAAFLTLWLPLPASSFSQNGGNSAGGGAEMLEVSGKVVETMAGGGYTYALVKMDGSKVWVALPKSNITVGDTITCRPGMVMNNFPSSSLNRTFERIVFSSGLLASSGSASSAQAPTAENQAPTEETDAPEPKAKPINDWGTF
jgi:hypothetical protein